METFDVGKLRAKVLLMEPVHIDNMYGEALERYSVVAVKGAQLLSTKAVSRALSDTSREEVTFLMRYQPGLHTDMKLSWRDKEYLILSIEEVGGHKRFVKVLCSRVVEVAHNG